MDASSISVPSNLDTFSNYLRVNLLEGKRESNICPKHNQFGTTLWRPMGECMYSTTFFTSHYMEVSDQLNALAVFTLREIAPDTHWIRSWTGPRGGLDAVNAV
jgi:hypothetical protein